MVKRAVTRAEAVTALAEAARRAQQAAADPHVPRPIELSKLEQGQIRELVRTTLTWLAQQHPGRSVEIRVPPHAAVQAFEGPRHTRGTPPNVIETDPATWFALISGVTGFAEAVGAGLVRASGTRADLSGCLPLVADGDH